ncbi:hypothetical protein BLS_003330 [Venturia inaequalis]|uniref:Uncharacterized protein n=1 Tax=Venturia inaequalis TaxID=5025 RepID=A0A8H3UQU8_VENIN|nr:hypothetical protein EG328_005318 [Venturia inaequalis]KAE9973978.1 hypothetical protein BLS_003330 [Venturia inaequalis]RDI86859.1 hypothetical protein Vi05172_g3262 [Venturia inaequalis]
MRTSTLVSLAGAISLTLAQTQTASGLLMVLSKPVHPDLTDATFNQWYSGPHIHDMLASNITDLILRYKNTNPAAKYPYLALYRLPDTSKISELGKVPTTSDLLPGKVKGTKGGAYTDVLDLDKRVYTRTQTFEGQVEVKGRGKALVTASMGVVNGTEGELDDWYRRQHLDMLSMIKGYHRSTRYVKLDGSSPMFLAMHELDSVTVGPEMKLVLGTEWAKKVLSKVMTSQNDVWEYIIELGKDGLSEAQMRF